MVLIPLVNASILTVENENPQPFETIIGIISSSGGIDTTLTKSDLKFYIDGIQKTPQEYDIHFYEGNYYFYFIFSSEGNYTLFIDNVVYKTDSGSINSEDINKTFEIRKSDPASILQIIPGVIYGYNDFNIDLVNKGDSSLNIIIGEEEFDIDSGDSKRISLGERNKLSFIEIESYKTFTVPIISLSLPTNIGEKNNESQDEDLLVNNGINLEYAIEQGKREDYSFSIESLIEEEITNIELTSNIDGLSILTSPEEIKAGLNESVNIKLKISEIGLINGEISFSYKTGEDIKVLTIPVTIYVSEEEVDLEQLNTSEENQTCATLGILVCSEEEDCSSNKVTICEDGSVGCLEGTCVKIDTDKNPTENSGKSWVAVLVIIIVIGLLAFVILQKYKKVK